MNIKVIWISILLLMLYMVGMAQSDTTIQVHLTHNTEICVGERIKLTCPDSISDKDVLTYEWVKIIGKDTTIIGKDRYIVVSPTENTTYHLNIQYLDMKNNLIKQGDFEGIEDLCKTVGGKYPNKSSLPFKTDYIWRSNRCGDRALWDEGVFKIGTNPKQYHPLFFNMTDHTSGDGKGQMLLVNGHPDTNVIVWQQKINNIKIGTEYAFSAWGKQIGNGAKPRFQFSISNKENNFGVVGGLYETYPVDLSWTLLFKIWKATFNEAFITLINQERAAGGNDFAVDDIVFAPVKRLHGEITLKVIPRFDFGKMAETELCVGQKLEVKPTVVGEATTYQWYKDNNNNPLTGETNKDISILSVRPVDAGLYTCIAKGHCGYGKGTFKLTVNDSLVVEPLADVTACLQNEVEFKVKVLSGQNHITKYEWSGPPNHRSWQEKFTDTYKKDKIEDLDVGKYTCDVTSKCGNLKVSANLSTYPIISANIPSNQIYCPGTTLTLDVNTNRPAEVIWSWSNTDGIPTHHGNTLSILPEGIINFNILIIDTLCKESLHFFPAFQLIPKDTLQKIELDDEKKVCEGEKLEVVPIVKGGENLTWKWSGPNGFASLVRDLVISDFRKDREGFYVLSVTDDCGHTLTDSIYVSVIEEFGNPVISGNLKVCLGESGSLEITGAAQKVAYLWTTPSGRTEMASSITLNRILAQDTGWYTCQLTSVCGNKKDFRAHVSLYPAITATGPLTPYEICEGGDVEFTVTVNPEEHYIWRRKGGAQIGIADKPFTINPVKVDDEGIYECVVTSPCGEEKVLEYILKVHETTSIQGKNEDLYVTPGTPVTLFVNAVGSDLTYSWTKTGSGNIGLNSNKLVFDQVKTENAGEYICTVTGRCGTARAVINLNVGEYNQITKDQSVNMCVGSTHSYTAAARPSGCTESAVLVYLWTGPDGREVSNTKALVLADVTTATAGVYTCTISGTCGTMTLRLTATVFEMPVLQLDVNKDTLCEGEPVKMTTTVNNVGGHTFEWRHDGKLLNTTVEEHTINDIALNEAGKYTCKVTSFCGTDTKDTVILVRKGLKIAKRPNDLFLCKGAVGELKVEATGDEVTYAWAGPAASEWTGSHDALYRNPAVSHDAAGQYRCVVGSNCGIDTLYANLDVEKDLELISRTSNLAVCIGENIKLWARTNLNNARISWTLPNGAVSALEEITINSVTTADRGRYVFYIESPAGCSSLKDSIGIGVYDEPGILSVSPVDTSVCEGGQAHFVAEMPGVDVTYSWMGPGTFKSDSAVIDIVNVTTAKTGSYQVIARDICKHERTAQANLALRDDFKNIRISNDTAVCLHSDVSFRVEGGIPGMVYSWTFGGVEIGNGPDFSLSNVDFNDAGQYICRITGICGFVEDTVELSVLRPLELEAVTVLDESVCAGETVVFGVKAEGVNVVYNWQKNGTDVGTMDSLLTLTDVERWNAGTYICHITSACGNEQLDFNLHVKAPTRITGRSPDKYVSILDSVQLFIITQGVNNHFEWKQNNFVIGTDSVYIIPDVGLTIREESFTAKVEGECGVDSVDILLRVGDYITVPILRSTTDTICEGSNYTYVAELVPYGCYGGEPVVYQWFRKNEIGDTVPIVRADSTSALFKINDVVSADTGFYKCIITYRGCPIDNFDDNKLRDTTFNLQLDMIRVPQITAIQPTDTAIVEGFGHEIKVVADGDALKYEWRKNDTLLPAEVSDKITFSPALLEDAGIYKVRVLNECSRMDATSRLKVNQKTVITSPLNQTYSVCRFSDTTMMVEALGANLIYRWYRDNRLVASSRKNEYKVTNVVADMDFRCVVEGSGGYDTCYFFIRVEELPELELKGQDDVCLSPESFIQQYRAESPVAADLMWSWSCTDGTITSLNARQNVDITWNGNGNASVSVTAISSLTGCKNTKTKDIRYVALPEVWLDLPEKVGYCIDSLVLNRVWPMGGKFVSEGDTVTALEFYVKTKEYGVTYYYTDPLTKCVAHEDHRVGIDVEPYIRLRKRNDTTGVCRPLTLEVASYTPGSIVWKGSGLNLDTTDVLKPVFKPVTADAENVYYEATLTDPYDCKASDYEHIRVVYPPQVKTMKDSVVGNCNDDPVDLILTAEYVTAYFNRIDWMPSEKVNVLADYTAEALDLKAGKNNFIAEVVDVFGCTGKDSLIVTLASGPDVTDREVCYGDTLYIDNSGYSDFRWSDGYNRLQRVITLVGTDTLWVKDEYGCEAKGAYTVRPLPYTNLADTSLMRGHHLQLSLQLNPDYAPYDILWQDGTAVPVYTVEREGEYWVKVVDNMGCTALDTALITLIEGIHAPNAFLPESIGENSRFYLKEVNFVENFEMYIYNRWGELIFKTREIGFNGGWDGTFKGKKCDVGTYVWVAFNNGKRLARGTVTLIK